MTETSPIENLVTRTQLSMPSPHNLRLVLEDELTRRIQAMREERGEVQLPEDTFPLVRALAASEELLADYSAAFRKAVSTVRQELEQELIEAQGEQDGQPNGGMTVPDPRGDVRLSLDTSNDYDIDLDALRNAVCAMASSSPPLATLGMDVNARAAIADYAVRLMLELGKFDPQVSKVRSFAAELSRNGDDSLAATVTSAIRKTSRYKGVKTTRK